MILDVNLMMRDSLGERGIDRAHIEKLSPQVRQIHKGLEDLRRLKQLPFRDLPYQDDLVAQVLSFARQCRESYTTCLLLGIGGSSLGPKFLTECLAVRGTPSLILCDMVDADAWREIAESVDWPKTLLLVISKSGKTTETLSAFLYFRDMLQRKVGVRWTEQVVMMTDPVEGPLRRMAQEQSLATFDIPSGVGGRYSIFTPVGLFPAALTGVDVEDLLAGARRMDDRCRTEDPWFNPALMSAVLHFLMDVRMKRHIRCLMNYGESLRGFAAWFSQLWAESLGKRYSLQGQEVHCGSTPVAVSGPQDQHSQLQLYLEGPDDKVTTFISSEKAKKDLHLPMAHDLSEGADLCGKSVHELLQMERRATELALLECGRPSEALHLKDLSPYSIGQLLYMAEVETVYAGALYDINPFDQPAVEKIKKHIKAALRGETIDRRDRSYLI